MKWFEGTIPEAITTSKAKKAVFVVFIQGKDDASKEVASALDSPQVSSRLESEKFVAIKLQSDSENYTFFAQIYQFVPVPSIFFIGENGAPLEIIGNALPTAELASKIDSILEKAYPQSNSPSGNLIQAESQANSSNTSQHLDNSQVTNNDASSDLIPTAEEKAMIEAELSGDEFATRNMSQEQKINRARELIELQKKKKQDEEEKKEREREIERRKVGKDLQKLRQQQQDKEIKEAHQERLREKAAEAAAREKILKQIAEDKLERKRKYEMQLQENNAQQQKQKLQEDAKAKAQAASVDLSKARIQFKLPTGTNITGTFESTSTLGTLRSYVTENAQLPFRQFSMSAFFPRKDFTTSDDDKTLLELDLAPSSVILILPVKSNNPSSVVKSSDGVGIFSHFFWTLLAPVVSMYNYIMGYFTGRPRAGGETDSSNENRNSENSGIIENSNPSLGRLANIALRRVGGNQGTSKIRARGNVHTLHSNDNDNDENNTWNGNSTQQM